MSLNSAGGVRLAAILAAAGLCFGGAGEPADEFPFYVGQETCRECHASGGHGSACSLEPIPEHAETYTLLTSEPARHIAVLTGEATPPVETVLCLGCHAASSEVGPRWTRDTFSIEDGVQCESCHRAGGLHVDARRSETPGPDGMNDVNVPAGREFCDICHWDKPSHAKVLREGYRFPATDALYRTPINLAVSADGRRLWVVASNGGSLISVDLRAGKVVGETLVGREPQDVALSPDGSRLYVSVRSSDDVAVVDATSREVLGRIAVGDDPHGLLVGAGGKRLYVLNTGDDTISVVDIERRVETKRLSAGPGPWSLAAAADGRSIATTNVRPQPTVFREPQRSEITVLATDGDLVAARVVVPDANMLEGIAAVPGSDCFLFTLVRTKNLVPLTRLAQGWTITSGLGITCAGGGVDQILLDEPNRGFPDPEDVAVSPDGRLAAVTSGGADEVALVDVSRMMEIVARASPLERAEILPNHLGLSDRFVRARIAVCRNPRGATFSPDGERLYVTCALDDSVAVIDTAGARVERQIDLGGPKEITAIRKGERVFHSAANTAGRQFSCRGCHPDGHINGLTFDIEAEGVGMHPVDNRTLRGILDTAPFKWEGTNPSFARQCGARLAVFFTRLAPFTDDELDALVQYLSSIPRPPNRHRAPEGLTPAQRRGLAVFERTTTNDGALLPPEQRCNACHNTPYYTARTVNNVGTTMWFDAHTEVDLEYLHDTDAMGPLGTAYFREFYNRSAVFDTPHLNNIYASPPYLHNGGAETLEHIWTEFNLYQGHGKTHDLTRRQLNDLVAYLKSL